MNSDRNAFVAGLDGETVVSARGPFARWGFAEWVRDCCSFGSERVVSEAELCLSLADGAFGVAEVGVGVACGTARARGR